MTRDAMEDATIFKDMLESQVVVREGDPRGYPADLSSLHTAEAALMQRAIDSRRREFTAGRTLAREAFELLGLGDVTLVNGDDRAPVWPKGIVGSITHTKHWCAVAVAPAAHVRGIGLDIEPDTPLQQKLWESVCTPGDLAWLQDQPAHARGWLAKAIFSAKECAYKAQYGLTRQFLGFQAMSVTVDAPTNTWRAVFQQSAGDQFATGDVLVGKLRRTGDYLATACMLE